MNAIDERGLFDHREHIKSGRWSILPKKIGTSKYDHPPLEVDAYTVLKWSFDIDGCYKMSSLNKDTKALKLDRLARSRKLESYIGHYGGSSWETLIVVSQHKNTKPETLEFIFNKVTRFLNNNKDIKERSLLAYKKMLLGSLSINPNTPMYIKLMIKS